MDGGIDMQASKVIRMRGIAFPKHPDIIRGQVRNSLRKGTYETREAEAALRIVRDGDRVLELGGGIGFMSSFVALRRKVERIEVFEANPKLVPYIETVHAVNGVTTAAVHNALLGLEDAEAEFHVRQNVLASSLNPDAAPGVTETVRVPVRAAGRVTADLKPTVLICDIEGAEAALIPQMDLSGLRAAVVELHPQWIGPEGVNAVFRAFMAAGLAYSARASRNKVVAFRKSWPVR